MKLSILNPPQCKVLSLTVLFQDRLAFYWLKLRRPQGGSTFINYKLKHRNLLEPQITLQIFCKDNTLAFLQAKNRDHFPGYKDTHTEAKAGQICHYKQRRWQMLKERGVCGCMLKAFEMSCRCFKPKVIRAEFIYCFSSGFLNNVV